MKIYLLLLDGEIEGAFSIKGKAINYLVEYMKNDELVLSDEDVDMFEDSEFDIEDGDGLCEYFETVEIRELEVL